VNPILQKRAALVAVILLFLGLIGSLAAWYLRRSKAIRVLESAQNVGLQCEWRVKYGARWTQSRWIKILPISSVTSVSLDYDVRNAGELARAIKVVGAVEEIGIGQGDPDEIETFLSELGCQRALRAMYIFNVPLEGEIGNALGKFPNLRILALVGSHYSASDFPTLEALEELDIRFSPVTDDGLAAILKCPKLRAAYMKEPAVTGNGIEQIEKWRQRALKELAITEVAVPEEDVSKLERGIQAACPDLEFSISAR